MKKGFTLIELLVVISIIGVLSSLIVNNLSDARTRARDSKKKSDLQQVKTALRLYYNDYQIYPDTDSGVYLKACGQDGDQRCPVCSTADFAAGGADGCDAVYMQSIPQSGNFNFFKYYQCDDGDNFRLKVTLENLGDSDILDSQTRCPADSCLGSSLTYDDAEYVTCAD